MEQTTFEARLSDLLYEGLNGGLTVAAIISGVEIVTTSFRETCAADHGDEGPGEGD